MYYNHEADYGNYELDPEFLHEAPYENEYNELDGEIMNDEGTFGEVTQMELASQLLSVRNDQELDMFLGNLFKKAVGGVSKFMRSGTGKALGGILRGVAKKALPIAGGAIGSFLAPGLGTAVGGALGSAASNLFEIESEGLSQEDRDFEVAKAYVRLAGNAARRASQAPRNQNPVSSAKSAITVAARRYAPGLLVPRRTIIAENNTPVLMQLNRIEDLLRDMNNRLQNNQGNNMNEPMAVDFAAEDTQNEYWG